MKTKKNEKPKKLTLSRETLRNIDNEALGQARGGMYSTDQVRCPTVTCRSICPDFSCTCK
jgi:hypothetical protein